MRKKWALIIDELMWRAMRKTPLRKCIITQERHPKQSLIRVVKNQAGDIFIDPTGKANGRGAYLKKDITVIRMAQKKKSLEHVFSDPELDASIYEQLITWIKDHE